MSGSYLDKGRGVDVNDSLKEIMGVIREFYIDKDIEQKTELEPELINNMQKTEFKENMLKDRFNIEIKYTELIIKPKMKKLVSKKRSGRTEAMNVLQAQLSQIMQHPATALSRLFGR